MMLSHTMYLQGTKSVGVSLHLHKWAHSHQSQSTSYSLLHPLPSAVWVERHWSCTSLQRQQVCENFFPSGAIATPARHHIEYQAVWLYMGLIKGHFAAYACSLCAAGVIAGRVNQCYMSVLRNAATTTTARSKIIPEASTPCLW